MPTSGKSRPRGDLTPAPRPGAVDPIDGADRPPPGWRDCPGLLLAGLAVLIAPAYLRMASTLCIPVFEVLFWTLGSYLVVVILEDQRPAATARMLIAPLWEAAQTLDLVVDTTALR